MVESASFPVEGTSLCLKPYRIRYSLTDGEIGEVAGVGLAVVRDLREARTSATEEELAAFETDVLAGFVLARASAGLADSTIRNDTGHLELIRAWFGRPLWEMQPGDADAYFGRVLRDARPSTRTGRAAALTVYFQFLDAAQDRAA